jgi:hypothetical protein
MMQELFYAQDAAFGGGTSRYITRRDGRGYAQVALVSGAVPPPFVDKDKDGLADVDALGRFITSDGNPPPPPFFLPGDTSQRDPTGRALAKDKTFLYDYIDTSHTYAASLLADLKPLVNPDLSVKHETVMYAVAGAQIAFGTRDGSNLSSRSYSNENGAPVVVQYNAFRSENSPALDLVYALGQMMGDKTTDAVLQYTSTLFQSHLGDVARVAGGGMGARDLAHKHTEATIAPTSPFWDEMLDVLVKIAKEPGLLEDVMRAMGDKASAPLGSILANHFHLRDEISYDRSDINGPPYNVTLGNHSEMQTPVDRTQADTGKNRSSMQRFLSIVHNTTGVTACNKDGAVLHGRGIPLADTLDLPLFGDGYKECEVFKIDNLAAFYLDAIVGKANFYYRPSILRNGIVGVGAATIDTVQQSSGLKGFWDPGSATLQECTGGCTGSSTFHPMPKWLNRLVAFDLEHDSPNSGDPNYITNHFLSDLQGKYIGTSICPERIIDDPDPSAADASPDGKVHGLRDCADGDWLFQRDPDAMVTLEDFGFYDAFRPTVNAFVVHHQENLFLELAETLNRHWADDKGTASECKLSSDGSAKYASCGKDGVVRYEELISAIMSTDLIPALTNLMQVLAATTIPRCDAADPSTHTCTSTTNVDGIQVMADATRALLDPDQAQAIGLRDRKGNVTAQRNDGTTNPQVTPIYLLTNALNAIDAAFAANEKANPNDKDRLVQWRTARSQLVDEFMTVSGIGSNAAFTNAAFPKILPRLIGVLRAQMLANCPTSFVPPYDRCDWARDTLTKKMTETVHGPTFAATMDLVEAIRKNDDARTQIEALLTYLVNAASSNEALAAMLASSADMIQSLRDDANLVPIYHVMAQAMGASTTDASGNVVKSVVDSSTALLARIDGRAFDPGGIERCDIELDPNEVLSVALANLVTPMDNAGPTRQAGTPGKTPLEVILDVIGDVNRNDPTRTDKLDAPDYSNIAFNVSDFLQNKERGLEQFYEVVRQGTPH